MASPVAPTSSPARLLLHLSARLVTAWRQHVPDAQAMLPSLDLGPLYEPSIARTTTQRQAQLEQAVTVASWLVTDLHPCLALLEPRRKPSSSQCSTHS